ncbi:MAG: noncanonical pyrimidine nucleotidase, YjjG family [Ruminococcaceae bacterium]|nr:noncanonical pyrimidine nucleotidase, YjjG family [Oscillospiraceae bacterium]
MKKYTTLLLDADDTLLDFISAEASAIKTVCEKYNIPYSEEVRKTYSAINLNLWKKLEKGLITRKEIQLRRFIEFALYIGTDADPVCMARDYVEALSRGGMVLDGAKELCRDLSQKYTLYIVTNGITAVQESRLERSGLLPYFKDVFISEKFGSTKPEKRFFEAVFNLIDEKDLKNICIIGDSMSSDILGGINAGIDTCYFNTTNEFTYAPTYHAKNFEEIRKIFL